MHRPSDRERSRQQRHDGGAGASDALRQHSPLARFRDRLRAGNYDAVIGYGLKSTLRGAAADTGLDAEIGALRLTLARLLVEEQDPSRLATGISRVAAVAVQAARLRNGSDTGLDEIRAIMLRELDALENDHYQETHRETGELTK